MSRVWACGNVTYTVWLPRYQWMARCIKDHCQWHMNWSSWCAYIYFPTFLRFSTFAQLSTSVAAIQCSSRKIKVVSSTPQWFLSQEVYAVTGTQIKMLIQIERPQSDSSKSNANFLKRRKKENSSSHANTSPDISFSYLLQVHFVTQFEPSVSSFDEIKHND